MRHIQVILVVLLFAIYSFTEGSDKTGKELFIKNCSSCHAPDKALTAPPFQKIREDYGLDWTVEFLNNPGKLIKERDAKALFGYYRFGAQIPFKDMSREEIVKILDYVDSFPYDSSKYSYRKLSDAEKMSFVDSIESKAKKDHVKINQKEPIVDSSSHVSGTSAYGIDTTRGNKTNKDAQNVTTEKLIGCWKIKSIEFIEPVNDSIAIKNEINDFITCFEKDGRFTTTAKKGDTTEVIGTGTFTIRQDGKTLEQKSDIQDDTVNPSAEVLIRTSQEISFRLTEFVLNYERL